MSAPSIVVDRGLKGRPVTVPVATLGIGSGAKLGTALAFLCTALVLCLVIGRHFVVSLDEGIYLDGARRILAGQAPYKDFFLLMGPGSFWLLAVSMKLFGMNLAAGHAITILDLATLTACVYWLVARRVGAGYAAWIAAVFVILETADVVLALPHHRWDSAALATLAITILASDPQRGLAFAAGVCAAFAAWTTPTVGLVAIALMILLWFRNRVLLRPFVAGAILISLSCAGLLAWQGALLPMLQHMLWTGSNYSGPNFMGYGTTIGGYGKFLEGASGAELAGQILMLVGFTVPAILPPLVALLVWQQKRPASLPMLPLQVLLVGGSALVAATYPRMDVRHLTFAVPVFYALFTISLAGFASRRLRMLTVTMTTLLAAVFGLYGLFVNFSAQTQLHSRVGDIRLATEDARLVAKLDQAVPRGSRTFVFPYLPIVYFLTMAENPTRYSYLQPGMMSASDEQTALQELDQNPPDHVVWRDLPGDEILRIWPGTNPARLHLAAIETYLNTHYHLASTIPHDKGDLRILERNPAVAASADPEVR